MTATNQDRAGAWFTPSPILIAAAAAAESRGACGGLPGSRSLQRWTEHMKALRTAARVLTPAELAEMEADNRAFATREPAAMKRYARECAAATAAGARDA